MRKTTRSLLVLMLTILVATGCATQSVPTDVPVNAALTQPTEMLVSEAPAPEPDFRSVRWGMNINEVKENESEPLVQELNNMLLYYTSVANLDVALLYTFNDDGLLYMADYILNESHINDNGYVDDFNRLKNALIEKYGVPQKENERWNGGSHYQGDPDKLGIAIAAGYYSMSVGWDMPSTTIALIIRGQNFETNTGLMYTSKLIPPASEDTSGL